MKIILAPHPDDEIIGCYSVLCKEKIDKVVYVSYNDLRKSEAVECSKKFNFTPIFSDFNNFTKLLKNSDIVYVPHPKDNHPLHKYVTNKIIESGINELFFYSTAMNVRNLEKEETPNEKKRILDSIYFSQKSLWENNAKYYLFKKIEKEPYTKLIEISFTEEGIHSYPNAPKNVEFLKYPHRHLFKITVEIQVFDNDRELEFFTVKKQLKERFKLGDMKHKSCEDIATEIYKYVKRNFGAHRIVNVSVYEDGENGAHVRDVY
jgi:hypothetical protein